MISGLPPTPIAMVGREAIHAALNPVAGNSLYFVARGDGSHVFSDDLDAHNNAVREYQIRRRADYRSSPAPIPASQLVNGETLDTEAPIPAASPNPDPEALPSVVPQEPASEPILDAAPALTPEQAPEPAPEAMPEPAPAPTPEPTLTPESAPEPAPNAVAPQSPQ